MRNNYFVTQHSMADADNILKGKNNVALFHSTHLHTHTHTHTNDRNHINNWKKTKYYEEVFYVRHLANNFKRLPISSSLEDNFTNTLDRRSSSG